MIVSLIVAVAANGVIGHRGALPWRLPGDLRWFKDQTMGKPLVMGRKTFDSIGRPLPGRTNIVISRNPAFAAAGAVTARSLAAALDHARALGAAEAMVAGGGEIFAEALPLADRIYYTRVAGDFPGDVLFPALDPGRWRETCRSDPAPQPGDQCRYSFHIYERV